MDSHYDDGFPKERSVGNETLLYDVTIESNSDGPPAAALLARDGRAWRPIGWKRSP